MSVADDSAGQALETDASIYKTLLESTRAIPWKIDWKTLQFAYIGPQIEPLLGWSQESWVSVDDWATRMHPDDCEWVVNFCVSQSQSGVDHEADYRALTASGDYVWIRDVVHVVRDEAGEVEALVGFMFDISERKRTEQELLRLQKELEELSLRDGLTGVANRRHLDQILEQEWERAQRHNQPLSLAIFDIDYFKQYNDCYGHLQGDECLKQVAQLLQAAIRSGDFLARFGGEEFVLVLPQTDRVAAQRVIQRCYEQLAKAGIAHSDSPISEQLTFSCGLGSCLPGAIETLEAFVERVDRSLYEAKHRNRNALVIADTD
ncbi:sensor domain-containing diguanylate cyclase [Marinobacterium iners]|uniref:sensor domain-containing diguanylate cyclase n=1 Tax=Marinobacterium iners TaxID=48076 RepID=UPI001A8C3374|nr:sensor domain-containing diguanylate cyclase [Marinobacterium iners]QSR35835.1 sensor domain-containing diguanylate cyclase [Marinobacterium iners]